MDGGETMSETETCQKNGCENDARWTWHDGMWAGGYYCNECIRAKLDSENDWGWPEYRDPITTAENVTRLRDETVIIPAGAQPLKSRFPTIRSQEAFDEYVNAEEA